jgi:hypothetical protein
MDDYPIALHVVVEAHFPKREREQNGYRDLRIARNLTQGEVELRTRLKGSYYCFRSHGKNPML